MISQKSLLFNKQFFLKDLLKKTFKYLLGQGLLQILNISLGIFILRILPKSEYSLYVIQTLFITSGGLLSNLGISQGITTLGAFNANDNEYILQTYITAVNLTKKYYKLTVLGIIFLSITLLTNNNWSRPQFLTALIFTIPSIWISNIIQNQQAILYIKHDEKQILKANINGFLFRFFITGFCIIRPDALIAIIGNFIGLFFTKKYYDKFFAFNAIKINFQTIQKIKNKLNKFIKPLYFNSIYFGFQSYIAILILGIFGYKESIAELGALGRINIIFGLLSNLNLFLIQPYFAKIKSRKLFLKKLLFVFYYFFLISALIFITAIYFPNNLLFVLGKNYSNLENELIISLLNCILIFINSGLYIINISKANTNKQYLIPIIGIILQFIFLLTIGINNTSQALYFNLFPYIASIICQILFLIKLILNW